MKLIKVYVTELEHERVISLAGAQHMRASSFCKSILLRSCDLADKERAKGAAKR